MNRSSGTISGQAEAEERLFRLRFGVAWRHSGRTTSFRFPRTKERPLVPQAASLRVDQHGFTAFRNG